MPVWYLYEDGTFIILTGRGSQKHRNIERHQDVTIVVDQRNLPYYAVMIQGIATIGAAPSYELRLRMATRYLGVARAADYTARRSDADSVTIRVRPEKVVEYRGVTGREP
jgi:nitroimidazol reductase NimA-like FMN-containing flavoprotein (pyridoxamine 5'-phosphate oxidase superfamily)